MIVRGRKLTVKYNSSNVITYEISYEYDFTVVFGLHELQKTTLDPDYLLLITDQPIDQVGKTLKDYEQRPLSWSDMGQQAQKRILDGQIRIQNEICQASRFRDKLEKLSGTEFNAFLKTRRLELLKHSEPPTQQIQGSIQITTIKLELAANFTLTSEIHL